MFGRRNYVVDYDRLNPKCAKVFHPMVDELSKMDGTPSAWYFRQSSVRAQLDVDYHRSHEAVRTLGAAEAWENLIMHIALGTSSLTPRDGLPGDLYGMFATVPVIRRVVFGHAPGFSKALGRDVYDVSLRTFHDVRHMLKNGPQSDVIKGARRLWDGMYQACIECVGGGAPENANTLVGDQPKSTCRCPACSQSVRVPAGKNLRIKCPTCTHVWVTNT